MEVPRAQEAFSGLRRELSRGQEFGIFVREEKLAPYKRQGAFFAVAHQGNEAADAALAETTLSLAHALVRGAEEQVVVAPRDNRNIACRDARVADEVGDELQRALAGAFQRELCGPHIEEHQTIAIE